MSAFRGETHRSIGKRGGGGWQALFIERLPLERETFDSIKFKNQIKKSKFDENYSYERKV